MIMFNANLPLILWFAKDMKNKTRNQCEGTHHEYKNWADLSCYNIGSIVYGVFLCEYDVDYTEDNTYDKVSLQHESDSIIILSLAGSAQKKHVWQQVQIHIYLVRRQHPSTVRITCLYFWRMDSCQFVFFMGP